MLRGAQRLLWAVGFMILGYCGMFWSDARLRQAAAARELDRLLANDAPAETHHVVPVPPPHGGLVGRVAIPRLNISTVIFEGTDDQVLSEGVGHLSGSALPGQAGNVVLAAHRDSFFRGLRNVKSGDVVEVTTAAGTRRYTVSSTEIILPTQVSVLEPTKVPTLTLVTCYPFYFVGHAPKRFIVRGLDSGVEISQNTNRPGSLRAD